MAHQAATQTNSPCLPITRCLGLRCELHSDKLLAGKISLNIFGAFLYDMRGLQPPISVSVSVPGRLVHRERHGVRGSDRRCHGDVSAGKGGAGSVRRGYNGDIPGPGWGAHCHP